MSIKNDGHYCPATGGNRTDGLHEPLTERKYNATTLYIDLVENHGGYKAEISGVINYYDTQRYVNGKLIGDVIESVPVPPVAVQLNSEKSVNIELPRGIRFTAQITDDVFSDFKQ
ncbi:hypothetical protein [Pantoea dispersa]|uniref:hypothetical protein n=1 Tax=Pantoea dispersa TaxID=59814 RepID=UPI001CA60BD2|nr:hypothetical protein [Pantoea dispersa]QZY97842.1 hypothetical protein K7X52_24610 [Pantoea dispersa]